MVEMLAAADVAGLSTGVSGLLVAFIGIGLLFTIKRYVSKALNRG